MRSLVAREILTHRDRPAEPGARPVRLRAGAHPRGRVQRARQARSQEPAPWPRPASSRASTRMRWPARWRATTWPRIATRARAPRPTPSALRRGSRSRPRPTGRSALGSPRPGRPPSSSRRSASRPIPSETARSAPASRRRCRRRQLGTNPPRSTYSRRDRRTARARQSPRRRRRDRRARHGRCSARAERASRSALLEPAIAEFADLYADPAGISARASAGAAASVYGRPSPGHLGRRSRSWRLPSTTTCQPSRRHPRHTWDRPRVVFGRPIEGLGAILADHSRSRCRGDDHPSLPLRRAGHPGGRNVFSRSNLATSRRASANAAMPAGSRIRSSTISASSAGRTLQP